MSVCTHDSLFFCSDHHMFLLLSCSSPSSPHILLEEISTELHLPKPEQLDPSMSVITFPDKRALSVQKRYSDIEIRFFSGLTLEQAPTIQSASLTLSQIPIINYELSISKVQVDPEHAQIIFSHVLDGQTLTKSILQKRIGQIIEEESTVHNRLEAALK